MRKAPQASLPGIFSQGQPSACAGYGAGQGTSLQLPWFLRLESSHDGQPLSLQGEVLIKGQVRKGLLSDDPELAQQLKVGMVFQNGALFDSLTVGENVGFMLYEHTQLPEARVKVSCRGWICCVLSVLQGAA